MMSESSWIQSSSRTGTMRESSSLAFLCQGYAGQQTLQTGKRMLVHCGLWGYIYGGDTPQIKVHVLSTLHADWRDLEESNLPT